MLLSTQRPGLQSFALSTPPNPRPYCAREAVLSHNKARSVGPGRLPAQPWCLPKEVGRSCARSWRGNSLIVFRSEGLWLWGGAAGAGTWGQVSIGTFRWVRGTSGGAVDSVCPLQEKPRQEHHIRSGMLEQGPDRQRAPRCCSGGVSSINGASESRCSHDGPAQRSQQGLQHFRHWSSRGATGVHEGVSTPIG